ncbi:hypothetical protein GOP47_0005599 [Adiantum capillus-veneris]|uniref:MOSC domain-containing protein n=1 Tax=Adiantum capillus-veneris TaxID=13818 RepID=A0A9D4V611_ADICA|nr:hypothetical protein GOP47_0005599 [Adiantum capillus-veneris]
MDLPLVTYPLIGFKWDRAWMVVNSNGRMLTQRVEPRLALVEVHLPEEALNGQWHSSLPSDSAFSLRAPGMELLQVPLVSAIRSSIVENASVWEWTGSALDEGPDAADWFTRYLGKACRLVRFDSENAVRSVDPDYVVGYNTTFTDGFPLLLISQPSLDALNEKLPDPLSINRFRPNILVQGCEPFAEDLWETFTISNLKFHGVKLCSRCKVTTIDPETTEQGSEPLKTLQSFRAGGNMSLSKAKGKVFFGQNVVCEESVNSHTRSLSIRVGDNMKVLNKLTHVLDSMV